MKLYTILYVAGHVVGFAGPLPYGSQECATRTAEIAAEWDANWADPKKDLPHSRALLLNGKRLTRSDFRVHCEWRVGAPHIDKPVDLTP